MLAVVLAAGAACCAPPAAHADSLPTSIELTAGVDATHRYWSLWSSLTYAPFGTMQEAGWRVRVGGGGGRYHYSGYRIDDGGLATATLSGTSAFAEALIGYHNQLGPWTTKLFVGLHGQALLADPADLNRRDQQELGLKFSFENWLDITAAHWLSADLSWSAANDAFWTRARLGTRVTPELSVGLEASAFGDTALLMRRSGAFIRHDGLLGELVLSVGIADDRASEPSAYLTGTWLGRF